MSWVCNLSKEAIKNLKGFPKDHQVQIAAGIDELSVDPFAGDVRPIKHGPFAGALRKRVGKYRIVYQVDTKQKTVFIATIVRRSDTTYN